MSDKPTTLSDETKPKATVYTDRRDALNSWVDGGMTQKVLHAPVYDNAGELVFLDLWIVGNTEHQIELSAGKFVVGGRKPLNRDELYSEMRDEWKQAEQLAGEEA